MAFTLISVSRLDRAGCSLLIEDGECLYRASTPLHFTPDKTSANAAARSMMISELHQSMGHEICDDLREMVRKGSIIGIDIDLSS